MYATIVVAATAAAAAVAAVWSMSRHIHGKCITDMFSTFNAII